MSATENLREADRLMTICNACRYCEGLCAVFPAMEMRRSFGDGDLDYLANLCHQCGACYTDCQYSPPHEFNVNVPAALAKLRNESYARYAWPSALSGAFARNGLIVTLLTAASVAAFVIGFVAFTAPTALFSRHAGDFYAVMPHRAMVALFGAAALYAVLAFVFSLRAFWLATHGDGAASRLHGAGPGARRHFHVALSRRRWRRLHQRGRHAVVGTQALSPLHVLRLPAVFRRHLRCDDLSLRLRLARALCAVEPAGAARHCRRHRAADRPGGIVRAGAQARRDAGRRRAQRHGYGIHRDAVSRPASPVLR